MDGVLTGHCEIWRGQLVGESREGVGDVWCSRYFVGGGMGRLEVEAGRYGPEDRAALLAMGCCM